METQFPAPTKYEPKNFEPLIGRVPGLSDQLLREHFGLYEGYVKKTNEIGEKLSKIDRAAPNASYAEYSELKRRFAVPFNGMVLHELFFENLCGDELRPEGELRQCLERDFGSFEGWLADAKACLGSVHGWCLLTRSRLDGRLMNLTVEEHHIGMGCEQDILLVIDAWEHAYMRDYGTAKADYVKTILKAIDWRKVESRFERAARAGVLNERRAA